MALRNDIVMVLLLLVSDESGKLVGTHRKSHPFVPGEITLMISGDPIPHLVWGDGQDPARDSMIE